METYKDRVASRNAVSDLKTLTAIHSVNHLAYYGAPIALPLPSNAITQGWEVSKLVSVLIGALSPVNQYGLYQG